MKLTDLEPFFFQFTTDGLTHCELPVAHAVHFLCPGCFVRLGGAVGCHAIHIPFAGRGPPPAPYDNARWQMTGTGLHDLTLTPSVMVYPVPITKDTLPEFINDLCKGWHGFITKGEVIGC